jgi:predicted dinucleotide-binding enzyme
MNIAVVGTGTVGGTLGRRFADAGHSVTFGARNPGTAQVTGGAPNGSRVTTVAEAGQSADVIVLTVPWSAVPDAIKALGDVDGKVLVDVTNPLKAGANGLFVDVGRNGESGAERIAAMVPTARVVKAFNQTGAENMADPLYGGERTVMFYVGDDPAAKAIVRDLITAVGFEAVDAGALSRSRELEHLAMGFRSPSAAWGVASPSSSLGADGLALRFSRWTGARLPASVA